jgi:hypothetical protein
VVDVWNAVLHLFDCFEKAHEYRVKLDLTQGGENPFNTMETMSSKKGNRAQQALKVNREALAMMQAGKTFKLYFYKNGRSCMRYVFLFLEPTAGPCGSLFWACNDDEREQRPDQVTLLAHCNSIRSHHHRHHHLHHHHHHCTRTHPTPDAAPGRAGARVHRVSDKVIHARTHARTHSTHSLIYSLTNALAHTHTGCFRRRWGATISTR